MAKLYIIEQEATGKVFLGYNHRGEPRFVRLADERRCVVYCDKSDASQEVEALNHNGYAVKLLTLKEE